jgi:hypothetical protein
MIPKRELTFGHDSEPTPCTRAHHCSDGRTDVQATHGTGIGIEREDVTGEHINPLEPAPTGVPHRPFAVIRKGFSYLFRYTHLLSYSFPSIELKMISRS